MCVCRPELYRECTFGTYARAGVILYARERGREGSFDPESDGTSISGYFGIQRAVNYARRPIARLERFVNL